VKRLTGLAVEAGAEVQKHRSEGMLARCREGGGLRPEDTSTSLHTMVFGLRRNNSTTASTEDRMRRELTTLTGIRGVAAIWVVLFHFYPVIGALLGGPDRRQVPIVRDGYLGVDLFFVLSGFVLSLAYSERFRRNFYSAVIEFFFARVGRIFPLHWTCLAIFFLLVELVPENWWGPGPFTLGALGASVALVQNWTLPTALAWNFPTWSLSAEWAAYLLFPLLTFAISLLPDVMAWR
jgi:peptidoglycan/LPS O-acetylase OafA/YrhL